MIKGEFEVALFNEPGPALWRRKDRDQVFPATRPLDAAGVAADLLECMPDYDGTLAAEYEAAGAMLHVRGESGYFEERTREPQWLPVYRRLVRLVDCWNQVPTVYSPLTGPKWEAVSLGARAALAIDKAVKEVKARQLQAVALQHGEVPESLMEKYDRDFDLMRRYIRTGYRKAQKRYHRQGVEKVRDMFERIELRVSDVSKRASESESLYVFAAIPSGRLIIHYHNSMGRDILRG